MVLTPNSTQPKILQNHQPENIHLNAFTASVLEFLRACRETQNYIPKFVEITNIDPNRVGILPAWLTADRQCLSDLRALEIRFSKQTQDFNERFFASANGFDGSALAALVTPVVLRPVSEERERRGRTRKAQKRGLTRIPKNISFDPNGPTEMYADFNLTNPGPPTTIKNWALSVYDQQSIILANYAPRVVNTWENGSWTFWCSSA